MSDTFDITVRVNDYADIKYPIVIDGYGWSGIDRERAMKAFEMARDAIQRCSENSSAHKDEVVNFIVKTLNLKGTWDRGSLMHLLRAHQADSVAMDEKRDQ